MPAQLLRRAGVEAKIREIDADIAMLEAIQRRIEVDGQWTITPVS